MQEAQRQRYLAAMGVQVWRSRGSSGTLAAGATADGPVPEPVETAPGVAPPLPMTVAKVPGGAAAGLTATAAVPTDLADMNWDALAQRVAGCRKCAVLADSRFQTVFGVGDRQARWMFIGEAPGADEDRQGEPFVGRAGQLLTAMIQSLGLRREQVYIANILKCRPPNNRDPLPDEVENCLGYLHRQIELVNPRLIVLVGRIAAQSLLGTDTPIGKLRGQVHRYGTQAILAVVTYHPAYLLRSPAEKRKAWEDLLLARRIEAASRQS